jgi:hypothetical protein
MAMCVVASVGAASASAAVEGPLWLVNGVRYDCNKVTAGTGKFNTLLECLGGPKEGSALEWELQTLTGTSGKLELDQSALALASKLAGSGNFKLKAGSLITVECTTLTSPTTLVGGMPGKDHAKIQFSGCSVAGKTQAECMVHSPGKALESKEIETEAKTELVYLKESTTGGVGDLFEPESGSTFVELVVEGTSCPTFTQGTNKVEGSVIGEAVPIGTMAKVGVLKFPTPIIAKGFRLENGKFKEFKSSLKVFSIIGAEQIGEAEVMLNSEEEWGVTPT